VTVFDDLAAEQDRLEGILGGLGEAQWLSPSDADGWTVADVVLHLAQSEESVLAWVFGPAEAESGISGPARDFCRVAAHRLAPDQARMTATGPHGAAALRLLRTYAE